MAITSRGAGAGPSTFATATLILKPALQNI